jgi:type IV fimbrial biogenesis protein FimT
VKHTLSPGGFTLTELMITVAIMGIVAALAFPMVIGRQADRRLEGATQQLVWDLMAARQEAITQNRRVQVFFEGSDTYKICYDADNDGTVTNCEGNAKITNIQDKYHDVTISSTNNPIFLPRGIATNLPTVTVQNAKGSSNDITINITGRVKIN